MAGLLVRTFHIPVRVSPTTVRTAQYNYAQGLLTGITNYASLNYHSNLLTHRVFHINGVTETQDIAPNAMRRPLTLAATGSHASWSSGTYAYDGAGNIKNIGTSSFGYDRVSRLTTGTIFDAPDGTGTPRQQTYSYDLFGNLTAIVGANGRSLPTSNTTNRLTGAGVAYDAAGNLTNWNGAVYEYDRFNQMTKMTSGSEDWRYIYTADDERIWSFKVGSNFSRWTLRDLDAKVLREFENNAGVWSASSDYFYRNGQLLAAETDQGRRHYHLDHLGTPRLITDRFGYKTAYHVYFPFGEEATAFDQDTERMKFTGHERDLGSEAGAGDDLDYMHARHHSPVTGRFLSVDPSPKSQESEFPQSWNRYAYTLGNPLKYIDPDGMARACPPEGCPDWLTPTTFWQRLQKGFYEASMLPGPSAMAVGPRVAGSFFGRLFSKFGLGSSGGAGSRIASLGSRLENIFSQNLTKATAEAAARESLGEVVALKATGEAFDHITKYERARAGTTQAIDALKRLAGDQRLSDAERAFAEYLLRHYSKRLDAIEKIYQVTLTSAAK